MKWLAWKWWQEFIESSEDLPSFEFSFHRGTSASILCTTPTIWSTTLLSSSFSEGFRLTMQCNRLLCLLRLMSTTVSLVRLQQLSDGAGSATVSFTSNTNTSWHFDKIRHLLTFCLFLQKIPRWIFLMNCDLYTCQSFPIANVYQSTTPSTHSSGHRTFVFPALVGQVAVAIQAVACTCKSMVASLWLDSSATARKLVKVDIPRSWLESHRTSIGLHPTLESEFSEHKIIKKLPWDVPRSSFLDFSTQTQSTRKTFFVRKPNVIKIF